MNRFAFAMLLAGALLAFFAVRVLACGITECQPHGGITHPDLEDIIMGRPPHHEPPAPPAVGGPTEPEEDTPPTPTATIVPPWVFTPTPTPVPVMPRWELPKALPHAGN